MPHLTATSPRRRTASALLAAALYLMSAVAIPLVHADTEVLSSAAEYEAAHMHCATIHAENTCLVCGAFQFPAPTPKACPRLAAERRWTARGTREPFPAPRNRPSQHLVRAPPTR